MMYQFLTANRSALIARCRDKVALRSPPGVAEEELAHGATVFLDQLIQTLMAEGADDPQRSRQVSGVSGGSSRAASEIGDSATRHGRELMGHGFTIEEVVHDYGDLCQAISDLAFETGTEIGVDEFRTLNRCLDSLEGMQRQSITIAYFQGMSGAELAEHLAAPLGSVKSWIRRGMERLRRCLES